MNKTALLSIITALFFCGCELPPQSRHVITGEVRPATIVESVKVRATKPVISDVIGTIIAQASGTSQKSFDEAMLAAKQESAKLGANGLTMTSWKILNGYTYLAGIAYFVPNYDSQ
jgi:hypothetical protein